jgi:hypothetical protein
LNARNLGLDSCSFIPPDPVKGIVLSGNPINSFLGFPPIPTLTTLEMENTHIQDFRRFPVLKSLESISLRGSPVMSHPHARTALLIVAAPSLRTIDGEVVTGFERQFAAMYPPECAAMIRAGWMPTVRPPKRDEIEAINRTIVERRRDQAAPPPSGRQAAELRYQSDILREEELRTCEEIEALEREIRAMTQEAGETI